MGTKVHCESYLPGYLSMRDPNEGSSSSNWPLIYGDRSIGNGQYRNGYLSTSFSNSYLGGNRDAIKQKMLEHDAIFQHQVSELHRVYRTQLDMMDDMKQKELYKHRMLMETSSSSSPLLSQMHPRLNFSYLNSIPVVEINSPPLSSARENINFPSQNGCSSKDCEVLEVRPSKARKKLFDLQLPADEYVEPEEEERAHDKVVYNGDMDTYTSSSRLRNHIGLADLNEPVQVEEQTHLATFASNSSHCLLGSSNDVFKNPKNRNSNRFSNNLHVENKGDRRDTSPYTLQGHNKSTDLNFFPQGAQRDYSLVHPKRMDSSSFLEPAHVTDDLFRGGERIVHGFQIRETTRDLSSLYNLKPISTFTQKLGTSNTSSQSPSQHQDIMNRLYRGPPPSWIKDPPPRSPLSVFENSKYNKYDKVASERSINYSPSKMAKEVNLNACIEIVDVEKECENKIKALPWPETEKNSASKLFGVPIFNKSCCTTKESSSLVSTSASLKGKSAMIDINLACDIECSTEIAQEKPLIIDKSCERALFDLNSCVSEDEITVVPSMASTNVNNKRVLIDLEAPPVTESDEDILPRDEEVSIAAEAIITISSLVFEAPSPDPLLWFADTVSDFVNSFENSKKTPPNEKIDDFEAATLNLAEMTEDEYMPRPVERLPTPDENAVLENGNILGRSRAARRRRGGRRRDFQRDILPGLASLSRHEVSEDIQTFGSLMRASGHAWGTGTTRRNRGRGRGRGRRRAAPDVAVDDVAVADMAVDDVVNGDVAVCPALAERGDIWGETPRRPRRQRGGGSGNSPSINLG